MTVDTSREAVEAVIKRLCNMSNDWNWNFYGNPAVDTLAALLDERDKAVRIASERGWNRSELEQRIRDLEADLAGARGVRDRERGRAERAEAELLHARGISEIRGAERDKLTAKLDAVKAWLTDEDKATEQSWSDYNCGRGDAAREALAILADTDEPKAGWVCSKCAREAVRGYDDGQIPEHHRTCSKRMPDTDEPRDSITFNTDDLGPATDIDGNPLADTDEGNGDE